SLSFFFQAEDGIRDRNVTGVQTCALPISGGQTSMGYSFGLMPAVLLTIPSLIGIIVLYYLAPKVRSLGKYTVSSILEEKYGEGGRVMAAVIIIVAYIGIVSYQMKGVGFTLDV